VITDWKNEIVNGVIIQQRIEELDHGRLWRRHLPEVAATEQEIMSVERRLGFALDPRYRAFLQYANGWKSFYQAVDLFGTANLLGAPPMDSARRQLAAIQPAHFEAAVGKSVAEFLPIAASTVQRDIFLLGQPRSAHQGIVVWFAGDEVDRFPSFDDFYLAMLDYNREEIVDLEREAK